ncbi:MAG TPA: GDYXXLXY domain-containing protein, partial [Aquaticitalea sp.]|nr:GDYXXLXY domain-containing protein [Aquaticitalea sp.]
MKPIYIFSIFIILVLAQLFVPASMILHQEDILERGTAYKFKTQPIDPADPFKGKYIRLNYDINSMPSTDSTWVSQEDIYIMLTTDRLGFAKIRQVLRDIPADGDYVKAKVDWYNVYEKEVTFSLPFEEFYMNEDKAYNAELAHTEAQRDSLSTTYALVYVLEGDGVLENVYINDIPIA